jgi:hypothetical protein
MYQSKRDANDRSEICKGTIAGVFSESCRVNVYARDFLPPAKPFLNKDVIINNFTLVYFFN